MHNTNQRSSRARLQHCKHPRSLPTPNKVITRSSQPTQPATKDMGPNYQEWPMESQGHTASLWGVEAGRGSSESVSQRYQPSTSLHRRRNRQTQNHNARPACTIAR